MPAVPTVAAHLPLDLVILGLFAVLVTIGTMRSGTQYAAAFSLAAPLALFFNTMLYNSAIAAPKLATIHFSYLHLATFGALFVLLLIAVYRMIPVGLQSGTFPIQSIFAGLAATMVLAVVWLQFPELNAYLVVNPLLTHLFNASYQLYWLLCAFLLLAIARS